MKSTVNIEKKDNCTIHFNNNSNLELEKENTKQIISNNEIKKLEVICFVPSSNFVVLSSIGNSYFHVFLIEGKIFDFILAEGYQLQPKILIIKSLRKIEKFLIDFPECYN